MESSHLHTDQDALEQQPASAEVAEAAHRREADAPLLYRLLRLGSGIEAAERPQVVESLAGLTAHLLPLDDGSLEVEVWARKRGTSDQVTYLAVRAAGGVDHVTHSDAPTLAAALSDVKAKMRRQLSDDHRR